MQRTISLSTIIASFVLSVAFAPLVDAADPPRIHETEIYNGPVRTVSLIGDKAMPLADKLALQDANRALDDMALQSQLSVLRRQYVNDEAAVEVRRRNMQQMLYGYTSTTNNWYYPNFQYTGYPWFYPFAYAPPCGNANSPALLNSYTYSLANGVGDEGCLKSELAHSLTSPAASEAATAARRNAEAALSRVGLSAQGRDYVVLKDGTRIEGKIVEEKADWVTLDLGGPKETIRMTEVVRIGKAK